MARTTSEIIESLKEHPDDAELHSELLEAYADAGDWASPGRVACILWMVRHDPGNPWCVTPYAHVHPDLAPDAFRDIRAAWLERATSADVDALSLRGAALFLWAGDRDEALALLQRAAALAPNDPKVWLDIGRVSSTGASRLAAFLEAHRRGDRSENVRAWIATTAATEGDEETATAFATALLDDARSLRARHGVLVEGPSDGGDLWTWARSVTPDIKSARALTSAISTYAYFTHQAHTALGVAAVKRSDAPAAIAHLESSLQIRPDPRLGAYGPSLALVRALCAGGFWEPAERFLRQWNAKEPNESVDEWLASVALRVLPKDDDAA